MLILRLNGGLFARLGRFNAVSLFTLCFRLLRVVGLAGLRMVREKRILRLFIATVIMQRDERAESDTLLYFGPWRLHSLDPLTLHLDEFSASRNQLTVRLS